MDYSTEIKVGQLNNALNAILREYGDKAIWAIQDAATKAGKEAAKTLRETSPKKDGKYAKGWTTKTENERMRTVTIVYNKSKPSLTHLLEFGHANDNGGRTPAHPHIAPANDEAQKRFIELVEEALEG